MGSGSEKKPGVNAKPLRDDLPQVSAVSVDPSTANLPRSGEPAVIPKIAGYDVIGLLGEGGMGTVWRAVQVGTKRHVALKLMRDATRWSLKARTRFAREVELASRLEHPNITRVYDSGAHQGVHYYAMELIEGVSIDRYVRKKRLTQGQIITLLITVGRAVEYAHQRGVIHRDLKPSNILVTTQGRPYVLDFGLAKPRGEGLTTAVSVTGEIAGTLAYMSPEQASGQPQLVDTRTDVYALGVVLFRLLTGQYPHDITGDPYQIFGRITRQEVRRPREVTRLIDRELEAILLKALARLKDKRYGSVGHWVEDLTHYLNGDPISARPLTAMYYLRKRLWKHRAAVGISSLVLTLGAGLMAVGYPWLQSVVEKEAWYQWLVQGFQDKAKQAQQDIRQLQSQLDAEQSLKADALADARRLDDQITVLQHDVVTLTDRLRQTEVALAGKGRTFTLLDHGLMKQDLQQQRDELRDQLNRTRMQLDITRQKLAAAELLLDNLRSAGAANAMVAQATSKLYTAQAQSFAQFLRGQMTPCQAVPKLPKELAGIILSYKTPDAQAPSSHVPQHVGSYDNAVAAIALIMDGDMQAAEKVLDAIGGMAPERPLASSRPGQARGDLWNAMELNAGKPPQRIARQRGIVRTGSTSWAGYALTYYLRVALQRNGKALDDPRARAYLNVAQRLADGLLERQISKPNDSRDARNGLITGGWGTVMYDVGASDPIERREDREVNWASAGHNIAAYFFLRDLADLTHENKYANAASRIRKALLALFDKDHGQFIRGVENWKRDKTRSLDVAYLGAIFLKAVNEKALADMSLKATDDFRTAGGGYRPECQSCVYESTTLQHFYFPNDKEKKWEDLDFVWTEGNLGVALAHHRFGKRHEALRIFQFTTESLTDPRGGLRHASLRIEKMFENTPSASASAWGIIVAKELAGDPRAELFLSPDRQSLPRPQP